MDKHVKESSNCCEKAVAYMQVREHMQILDERPLELNTAATKTQMHNCQS